MSVNLNSNAVIGQKVLAVRYSLTECVVYLDNGKQIIVEPMQFNGDGKKGNPYAGVRTVIA